MGEKISVCMASYNGKEYIQEQIETILANLSEEDELIISDDGSTDGTLDVQQSIRRSKLQEGRGKEWSEILKMPSGCLREI